MLTLYVPLPMLPLLRLQGVLTGGTTLDDLGLSIVFRVLGIRDYDRLGKMSRLHHFLTGSCYGLDLKITREEVTTSRPSTGFGKHPTRALQQVDQSAGRPVSR